MTSDELQWSHLDEIRIDRGGQVLRVEYSEPDQGGTRMIHRFLLPAPLGDPLAQESRREDGYAHDPALASEAIAWTEVPERVRADARAWIRLQLPAVRGRANRDLERLLESFLGRLGHGSE